jgi:DHA2 family multidrug resistance protein
VFLQSLLGYPAVDSGLAVMPRSLAMVVLMPIGGLLYNRLGPRMLVGSGLLVSIFSFWQLSHLTAAMGFWDIFFPQLWQGVGFSLVFVALSTAALGNIPKPKLTAATGLYNVARQVCGSIGIAIAATLLARDTTRYHAVLGEHVSTWNDTTRLWLGQVTAGMMKAGADRFTAGRRALELLDANVTRQAAVLAYNHVFLLITMLFVLGAPLVLLLRRSRAASGHAELAIE